MVAVMNHPAEVETQVMAQIHLQPLYSTSSIPMTGCAGSDDLNNFVLPGLQAVLPGRGRQSGILLYQCNTRRSSIRYTTPCIWSKHLTPRLKGWKNVIFKTAQGNNILWSSISMQTIATIDCMMQGKVIWSRLGVGHFPSAYSQIDQRETPPSR